MRGRAIGALSALTLCGILVAGLWPFHSPKNQIRWLGRESGLVFGDYGTILSSRMFERDSLDRPSCTLEIWLEPASAWKAGTVLSFYNPLNRRQLLLQQNYADLVLQRDTRDEHQQTILNVAQVFQREQAFITIASDGRDTAVYVDGNLVKLLPRVKLSLNDLTGQLIVGTSPLQSNSWPGRLRGLAIYKSELTAGQVARHYEEWVHDGKPAVMANERTLALYPFDERTGKIAHDQEKPGDDIHSRTVPGCRSTPSRATVGGIRYPKKLSEERLHQCVWLCATRVFLCRILYFCSADQACDPIRHRFGGISQPDHRSSAGISSNAGFGSHRLDYEHFRDRCWGRALPCRRFIARRER